MVKYYGFMLDSLEKQFNSLFKDKILKYSLSIDCDTEILNLELFTSISTEIKLIKVCEINFTKFGSIIKVKNFLYKKDIKDEKIYDDIVKIIVKLSEYN